jgi:hypothetical protein
LSPGGRNWWLCYPNEGNSATALVPDMFSNFLVKNPKIAKNSTTTKAREKNKHRFGILRIVEIF